MAAKLPAQLFLVSPPEPSPAARAPRPKPAALIAFDEFLRQRAEWYAENIGEPAPPEPVQISYVVMTFPRLRATAGELLFEVFAEWFRDEWASGLEVPFSYRVLAVPKVFENLVRQVRGQR
jgi:hypothetical protein